MKKFTLFFMSIVCLSLSLPTNTGWRDYVKPGITGSLTGGTAGSFYLMAGGGMLGGAVCGGIPLFLAATYNWGVTKNATPQVKNKQKKAILASTVAVGTGLAFMGGLVKWAFPVMMSSGAPGAKPGSTLATLAGAEAGGFLLGSSLASVAAYHLWKDREEANG